MLSISDSCAIIIKIVQILNISLFRSFNWILWKFRQVACVKCHKTRLIYFINALCCQCYWLLPWRLPNYHILTICVSLVGHISECNQLLWASDCVLVLIKRCHELSTITCVVIICVRIVIGVLIWVRWSKDGSESRWWVLKLLLACTYSTLFELAKLVDRWCIWLPICTSFGYFHTHSIIINLL